MNRILSHTLRSPSGLNKEKIKEFLEAAKSCEKEPGLMSPDSTYHDQIMEGATLIEKDGFKLFSGCDF